MTCVVAIAEGGRVWMAADSMAINGPDIFFPKEGKTWKKRRGKEQWLFGYSGSCAVGETLRYCCEIPPQPTTDPLAFMVRHCVPIWQKAVEERKIVLSKDSRLSLQAEMIVGVQGRIFFVDDKFYVTEPDTPFFAIGSGKPAAMAALLTMRRLRKRMSVRAQAVLALKVAATQRDGIGGKIIVKRI